MRLTVIEDITNERLEDLVEQGFDCEGIFTRNRRVYAILGHIIVRNRRDECLLCGDFSHKDICEKCQILRIH